MEKKEDKKVAEEKEKTEAEEKGCTISYGYDVDDDDNLARVAWVKDKSGRVIDYFYCRE